MILYKFLALSGHGRDNFKALVKDRELWFSPYTAFNDPYECLPYLKKDLSVKEFQRRYIKLRKHTGSLDAFDEHISTVSNHSRRLGCEKTSRLPSSNANCSHFT